MSPKIRIGDRLVGKGETPFVICELSANHNGDLGRALKMIEMAAETGADAIKIQTYTADTLTIDSDRPDFLIQGGLWDGRTLYDLYQEAQTPFEWHKALFDKAKEVGVMLFSTPFDETAVDLLEELDAPCYKIASFEVIDLPLIARAARTGKPLIISTGLAGLGEIEEAVATARANGNGGVALLHCTSAYPAPMEDANLQTIPHLSQTFQVPSGLSDHTPGSTAPIAAIALGASIIEKHFTPARSDGGPDAAFSLEPDEFRHLVESCRAAAKAVGEVEYKLLDSERANFKFRRSIYVVKDVAEGEKLTKDNIRSIRPGFGLPPKYFDSVIGATATRKLSRGEALDWSMVKGQTRR
jgi:N-acetylneuraminate synthase